MAKKIPAQRWMMPSTTENGTVYVVSKWADGTLSCNCKAWIFKKKDQERNCMHTRGVMVAMGVEVAGVTAEETEIGQKVRVIGRW